MDDYLETNPMPKKCFMTFSKMNKYFLIPFLTPIFNVLSIYFYEYISPTIKRPEFVSSINNELSRVVVGLFYVLPYFCKKIKKEKDDIILKHKINNGNSIEYIYNEKILEVNIKKIRIMLLILSFLMVSFETLKKIYLDKHIFQSELYFFISIILFSKFILKENIYKHHYLSLIMAISGMIIIYIPIYLKVDKNDTVPNIINFISSIFISLFFVLIKYIVKEFYVSPFRIIGTVGLLSIFFQFFVFIIYSLIKYHDFLYFETLFDFSKSDNEALTIIYYILVFIFRTLAEILITLMILYFSPILLMISEIIIPFLLWVIRAIKNGQKTPDIILYPIGYIIVIIAALIYNEIIIFNFCGFNKDTKKFIEQRLINEASDIKQLELKITKGEEDYHSIDDNTNSDPQNDEVYDK